MCVAGGVALGVAGTVAAQYVWKVLTSGKVVASAGKEKEEEAGGKRVLPNATATHFEYPRDTRRTEYWPKDSPEYKAGYARHNRVKPPMPEVEGDVFDRQRCIVGFDQGLVEKQVCFVLGTGGIGQNVALTLARLGVGKIILLDCDTYDASNLTRQCLGGIADVGRRKVDAAADSLRKHHNLRSEIETVHINALEEWQTVVSIARRSTVIFNAIDVGPMWDFCVNALGKELGVPTVAGQSYDWTWDTEFYANQVDTRCQSCAPFKSFDEWVASSAVHFGAKNNRDRKALIDRMFAASDSLDAEALVAFLATEATLVVEGPTLRTIIRSALDRATARAGAGAGAGAGADAGATPGRLTRATAPAFLSAFHRACLARMLPGTVSKQSDLRFVPKPKHVDTRFVGSWVCVCLAAGVHMVSQWVSDLFRDNGLRDDLKTPSTFTMVLGESASGAERGYHDEIQCVKQGIMPVDSLLRVPITMARDKCEPFCGVCQARRGIPIEAILRLS